MAILQQHRIRSRRRSRVGTTSGLPFEYDKASTTKQFAKKCDETSRPSFVNSWFTSRRRSSTATTRTERSSYSRRSQYSDQCAPEEPRKNIRGSLVRYYDVPSVETNRRLPQLVIDNALKFFGRNEKENTTQRNSSKRPTFRPNKFSSLICSSYSSPISHPYESTSPRTERVTKRSENRFVAVDNTTASSKTEMKYPTPEFDSGSWLSLSLELFLCDNDGPAEETSTSSSNVAQDSLEESIQENLDFSLSASDDAIAPSDNTSSNNRNHQSSMNLKSLLNHIQVIQKLEDLMHNRIPDSKSLTNNQRRMQVRWCLLDATTNEESKNLLQNRYGLLEDDIEIIMSHLTLCEEMNADVNWDLVFRIVFADEDVDFDLIDRIVDPVDTLVAEALRDM